jgi:protein-disulfide isomerase-like protein with CxxC motif
MVISMETPERHRKASRNIYQRRAYAAGRALTALERYSFICLSYGLPAEREKALRWVNAWRDFAFARVRQYVPPLAI